MWLDEDVKPAGVSRCVRGQAYLSDNITHLRNSRDPFSAIEGKRCCAYSSKVTP